MFRKDTVRPTYVTYTAHAQHINGEKRTKTEKPTALLVAGFAAGTVVTGLLNPVDRALFLSVSNRSPFLDAQNWRQPLQGLGQSIVSLLLQDSVSA